MTMGEYFDAMLGAAFIVVYTRAVFGAAGLWRRGGDS